MNLHRGLVEGRLRELATVCAELAKHRDASADDLGRDLGLRWIVERGILAGAGLVFDVADHVLAAEFQEYPETYEASLVALRDRGVVSPGLYARLRGMGQVRNLLAHEYVRVDLALLVKHLGRALDAFPAFAAEVAAWLDARSPGGSGPSSSNDEP